MQFHFASTDIYVILQCFKNVSSASGRKTELPVMRFQFQQGAGLSPVDLDHMQIHQQCPRNT